MATTRQSVSQEALRRRWQQRCQLGTFSRGILGIGTIRVFGKSGDAPVTFPRVESLDALEMLEADERWALNMAQDIITAAQKQNRPVMASQPPQAGTIPSPTPLRAFDPKAEHILILSLTRGG